MQSISKLGPYHHLLNTKRVPGCVYSDEPGQLSPCGLWQLSLVEETE